MSTTRCPRMIELRKARAYDAQHIGAVFDAAVREGWRYMSELAQRPMFPREEWDKLVADHAPPNYLLVATVEQGQIVGFVAVHPPTCEMYCCLYILPMVGRAWDGCCSMLAMLLYSLRDVILRFSTRMNKTNARSMSTRQPAIGAMGASASPTSPE